MGIVGTNTSSVVPSDATSNFAPLTELLAKTTAQVNAVAKPVISKFLPRHSALFIAPNETIPDISKNPVTNNNAIVPVQSTKESNATIHPDVEFVCKMCTKLCSSARDLQEHAKEFHPGFKPFVCSACDASFFHACTATRHLSVHFVEKPFKCNLCDYSCNRGDQLKVHNRYHTGERPYQCDMCDWKFTQSTDLRSHRQLHLGEKKFECNRCQNRFTRAYTLKLHMKNCAL